MQQLAADLCLEVAGCAGYGHPVVYSLQLQLQLRPAALCKADGGRQHRHKLCVVLAPSCCWLSLCAAAGMRLCTATVKDASLR